MIDANLNGLNSQGTEINRKTAAIIQKQKKSHIFPLVQLTLLLRCTI